jgi:hypothetical protein
MLRNGYKLHLDTNDLGLPVSALVTSASLDDNQVAIPLIKLAAYDAKRIERQS